MATTKKNVNCDGVVRPVSQRAARAFGSRVWFVLCDLEMTLVLSCSFVHGR